MTRTFKNILLCFAATSLLVGCDDNGGQSGATKWTDWLMGKDESSTSMIAGVTSYSPDFERQTQSGNYLAGQFAQYRQDWKTANEYMDRVIAQDPRNIELQQRSMILAMQAGDFTRALTLSRKVLEQDDKNLLALLFVGVDEIANQEYEQANRTLHDIPSSGVADFFKPILMAWSEAPKGKVDLDTLISGGPLHAYHALLIADYMGKVTDPNKYFVNILAGGGADKHMLESMADVFARQDNKDLANKIYDTLIEEYEKEDVTSSRFENIKKKRAGEQPTVALKIQTPAQGAAEVFYNMGRILFQDQSDESALVFARLAAHLDPAKEDAKMLVAAMMIRAGHMDDAVEAYTSIKPDALGYPEAQRSAAELLEKQGKVSEAIALLEKNYQTTKDLNNLIQIGDIYRRAEKHQDAIKAYDRAVDLMGGHVSSDYWSILYARGMSHEQTGNMKQAEDDLMAALEFQPNHPYLLNYLAYSWTDQGKKLDESLKMIEKAVALRPDDGYIVDSLGWVYYRFNRFQDAVDELERAVELVPYDPIINDHLGDAYWQVGRKNEARFQWSRAKNHSKDPKEIAKLDAKIATGLPKDHAPIKAAEKVPVQDKDTPLTKKQ